ncbi:MAG: gamma-glutamyltransferase, partial [Thermomicrobium sp.]|nr:gamma-glutamyltransferase [Thermomicrobium sp.]
LDKAYAAELRARIDPERATVPPAPCWESDTIALCVVDREGRAVSLIQSLYHSFGSGLVAAGIVLHNRGACFVLDERSPNVLAPGKRPLHTLIPAMALRDGRPWAVFGTMGGHSQPVIHLQLLTGLVDFDFEPQEAVEAPRWVSRHEPGEAVETVYLEPALAERAAAELRRLGHRVEVTEPFSSLMGHAHLIVFGDDGVLRGGSDPRAEGCALGW